jgi:hypothetical protein
LQSAYHQGGGNNHSLQLTGLQPGRTYDWQILTRDGDLRTSGQFQTTRRDYREGDRRDHDRDDRGYDARDYGNRVALYRASNRQGSVHLYTTNAGEQNGRGFHAEGNAGFILASQRRGTMPLYRMRGPNGDVLLTVGQDEVEKMRGYNYRDDGILGYVARTQMPGTQPFFRLVNQDGSLHFCTISDRERRQFLRNGWQELGPAGYIWTQQ